MSANWITNTAFECKMKCKIDKLVIEVQKWAQMSAKWITIRANECKRECNVTNERKMEWNVKVGVWSAEMSATNAK